MIKAVVFDLWETLIPATIDFVHLASLLKKGKVPMHDFLRRYELAVQLKKYRGVEELRKDFFKAFGEENKETLEEELYEVFFNRFDKIRYYPEAEEVLKKLKSEGYKLALLSNTESVHASEIVKKLSFEKYFDALCFSFEIGAIKPDEKVFRCALNELKIKPSEALMVGNSLRSDIGGAQKVGMHTCWINRKERPIDSVTVKSEFEISSLDKIFWVLGELNSNQK
ncbi:MAG: HAD family hydrolase [archaeon]|jgi:2-haloalkanoic acid dehalogenase type II